MPITCLSGWEGNHSRYCGEPATAVRKAMGRWLLGVVVIIWGTFNLDWELEIRKSFSGRPAASTLPRSAGATLIWG